MNFLLNQETVARVFIFIIMLMGMLIWESIQPCRAVLKNNWKRRINNFGLLAVDSVALRLIFSAAAVGMADLADARGWGLFNMIAAPGWVAAAGSFLCLDLIIYTQHLVFHKVPILWRLHRVHHTDTVFDTTTGVRFHPFEVILSMCIKILAVMILGAPPFVVLIFEIVLNATALFNHGNVSIPVVIERYLRYVLVTPDMHRVHHSVIKGETDSNYGFNVPWWDRLFGTYHDQPERGHIEMEIGLTEFRGGKSVNALWLVIQPFLKTDKSV